MQDSEHAFWADSGIVVECRRADLQYMQELNNDR